MATVLRPCEIGSFLDAKQRKAELASIEHVGRMFDAILGEPRCPACRKRISDRDEFCPHCNRSFCE